MPSVSVADWISGFQAARVRGREGQAYLIEGDPRGPALETAIGFLQSLACELPDAAPCGTCRSCTEIVNRRHPDIHWIEPEGAARLIPIDSVRNRGLAAIRNTAYRNGWKGVVLLHADRLSPSAGNALLKALEEPPPHTLLLLVTDAADGIPRTVLSRCRRIRVPGAGTSMDAETHDRVLEGLAAMEPDAGPLRRHRVAVDLAALLEACRDTEESGPEASADDETADIRLARARTRAREAAADILRLIELWQRDLLVCATGAPDRFLALPGYEEALHRQARSSTPADLMRRIEAVEQARRRLELNLAPDQVLDGFFQNG